MCTSFLNASSAMDFDLQNAGSVPNVKIGNMRPEINMNFTAKLHLKTKTKTFQNKMEMNCEVKLGKTA